jgi:calcineurin-like phosphoesterase family protein
MLKIVALSDTHTMGHRITVPDGDVLVHAGDLTFRGTEDEIRGELGWLESLPHKHKLFVAGNHDFGFDKNAPAEFRGWKVHPSGLTPDELELRKKRLLADFPGLTYLENSGCEIEGVKFYGSPNQPWFWDWAFNFPKKELKSGITAERTWAAIPDDTEVLITHGPPAGIRDRNTHDYGPENHRLGDPFLRTRLLTLPRLSMHIFGHIHGGYGTEFSADGRVAFINAASCNEDYAPINEPIVSVLAVD